MRLSEDIKTKGDLFFSTQKKVGEKLKLFGAMRSEFLQDYCDNSGVEVVHECEYKSSLKNIVKLIISFLAEGSAKIFDERPDQSNSILINFISSLLLTNFIFTKFLN